MKFIFSTPKTKRYNRQRSWWNPHQRQPRVRSILKEVQRQALATEDDQGMTRIGK
jgi:hypothetical protein